MNGGEYRLDELGWLQFERLCASLVALAAGVAPESWRGSADEARNVLIDDAAPLGLASPALAAVVWLRPRTLPELRRSAYLTRLAALQDVAIAPEWDLRPASAVVMTNAGSDLTADTVAEVLARIVVPHRTFVIGPDELARVLDARADLRRHAPAVLGVTDVNRLIPDELARASTLDRSAAERLARVFVATRPYSRALAALERYGFVVLTGPPEVGKTAIARIVGLVQMTDGWEAHECNHPDELLARYDAGRPQVFLADDAFGSTEYRPDAAERWARELDRVLARMDERHWLVWTSRPAPLAAGLRRVHRERGLERFPDPGAVQVDAGKLDLEEKVLILFRHARAATLDDRLRRLVQGAGQGIVAHRYFTPERIRRFVHRLATGPPAAGSTTVAAWIEEAMRTPTGAMATSLGALEDEHRDLLTALLDAPPSWVSERDLTRALRRHHPGGLPQAPHDLIDRLADHFLRVSAGGVGWVHPSWRDLVIDDLAFDPARRARFLSVAGVEGVLLALSVGGGTFGERNLPLLAEDADWDALGARLAELVADVPEEDLARLLHALAEAVRGAPEHWSEREASALAHAVLEQTTERVAGRVVPLHLLEAWLECAGDLTTPPDAPPIAPLWAELVPSLPLALDSREEIERVDAWSALADLLARRFPRQLANLGFPYRYTELIRALAGASTAEAGLRPAMRRLERIAPHELGLPPVPPPDVELTEPQVAELAGLHSSATMVASVLRDLD